MSTSNIQRFQELVKSDPAIGAKAEAARARFVEELVGLSAEAGFPCKAEDFAEVQGELSEVDLEKAAGGYSYPSFNNPPPK